MNIGSFLAGFGPGILDAQDRLSQQRDRQQRNQLMMLETRQRMKQMEDEAEGTHGVLDIMKMFGGGGGPAPSVGGTPSLPPLAGNGGMAPMPNMAPTNGGGPSGYIAPPSPRPAPGAAGNWEVQHNNFGGMRIPGSTVGPKAGGFQSFATPEDGISAISRQLDRYAEGKTTGQPLTTLRQIISTWAPPNENPTEQLIARASKLTGFAPDQALNVADPAIKAKLIEATIRNEQGGNLPIDQGLITRVAGGAGTQPSSPGRPPAGQAPASEGTDEQHAAQGTQAIAAQVPPDVRGKLSAEWLMGQIANAPGSDKAKMIMLEKLTPLLSPFWQQQMQMQMHDLTRREHEQDRSQDRSWQVQTEGRGEARTGRERQATAAMEWQVYTDTDGTRYRFNRITGEARTFTGNQVYEPKGGGGPISSGSASRSLGSKNIRVTDAAGKVTFSGAAHEVPGAAPGESSWVDDKTQQRIPAPDDATISIIGQGDPGRQSAAQMNRLTGAASEARRQLRNVAMAGVGTARSWFQGIEAEQGSGVREGLGRTLANQLTPRDAQIMAVLGRGVGRSLASLETTGAATGLVALAKSMQDQMPAAGDDISTALVKLADMRQIADAGIEAAMASPGVGAEQKKLLEVVRADIAQAIPFEVPDVLAMIQQPGEDTYRSFAVKIGLGKQQGNAAPQQPGGARYSVGQIIERGGKKYRVTGGDPNDPDIEEVPR